MKNKRQIHPETYLLARLIFPIRGLFEKLIHRNNALPKEITPQQIRIMMGLYAQQNGLRLSALREFLPVTQATLTLAVQKLIKMRLLEKQSDPRDKRALSLSLSPQGRALAEKTRQRMMEVLDDFYSHVPPKHRKKLIQSLEFIFQVLQAALQHKQPADLGH